MAITLIDALLDSLDPLSSFLAISVIGILSRCIYRLYLHPLAHIPGPLLPKVTSLWLHYHAYIGDEASTIHKAHKQYGTLVRVSPDQIDISDADAINSIYVSKGGFPKAPCYANFATEGYQTIFSTTDAEYRTPRAKAVVPMFSTKNIRNNKVALYGCVGRMVSKMQEEARTTKPVNILKLSRSFADDFVSIHLFQENYNGTSEVENRLSVSSFDDALRAVGRVFYLPHRVFVWFEWVIEKVCSG